METEIKKRNKRKGGTDYAKEKLAKAEAKIKEYEETICKQGTTISTLTAEKANLEGDVRYYRAEADKYWHRMGFFRRWLYELKNKIK